MLQTEGHEAPAPQAMGKSKLGVGIIGVSAVRGWATIAHIPALRALPNYELRALSAHSAESARAMTGHPAALASRAIRPASSTASWDAPML